MAGDISVSVTKLGERTSEWVWTSDHMEARSWVFLIETGRNMDRDLEPWRSKESDETLLEPWPQVSCVLGLQKCC